MSQRPFVVLGVSGGIAAYKSVELLRLLTESGHDVQVVPTQTALEFVGAATWAALSGRPVATGLDHSVHEVPHVRLGQAAELVLVAPATADLLARAVWGRSDDLLTATLLTASCPVVMAPAMHTEMWLHAATQDNVATLRSRGVHIVEPAAGRLTGADSGPGRLPEAAELLVVAQVALAGAMPARDLVGRRVVITAGGTREAVDPVRFLGNRSSGKQGFALARAAVLRGAEVTLVAANVPLPAPAGVNVVAVTSAEDLRVATLAQAKDADLVVMAAAVADFRPTAPADRKLKKQDGVEPPPLALTRTPDVLRELAEQRPAGQVLVGFAAETEDLLGNGRAKLAAKGCNLLVVNRVGADVGFELDTNAATILSDAGQVREVALTTKDLLAHAVLDAAVGRLG